MVATSLTRAFWGTDSALAGAEASKSAPPRNSEHVKDLFICNLKARFLSFRMIIIFPQGLKPTPFYGLLGTTEVVPCYKALE